MDNKETLVINFIGAPGTGKSVIAADLFVRMKRMGLSVELLLEYAKELFWAERQATFKNEIYIFGKQYYRLTNLLGKVDYVTTDAPLVQKLYYMNEDDTDFRNLVLKEINKMNTLNIFLHKKDFAFETNGRNQSEEESKEISLKMLNILKSYDIPFIELLPSNTEDDDFNMIFRALNTLESGGNPYVK